MRQIAGFAGRLLNHLQGFHRPGERELAAELLGALGFTCIEVPTGHGMSLLRAHLNPDDLNNVDNVIFLAETRPALARFDAALNERLAVDADLSEALAGYLESARNGDNTPHFGIHYRTNADLEKAVAALAQSVGGALNGRVTIAEMPYYGKIADFPDIRQIFVRTDVLFFGSSVLGQTIELQVERGK